MAKKGGVQQLQVDVSANDEFENLLERPELLVMDVYTEWCGPCVGMVGSLKRIKLEIGGDNLQLAICKSDTITALERFRNKSEPTWLFASHRKAVNIMFGTNVPKLMKLITEELNLELAYREGKAPRQFYEITELQPVELTRINAIKSKEDEAKRIEVEAASQKRHDYLVYVTTKIMNNMPDYGITIFAPHINRDLFKKILDVADSQMLQCKDRKFITVQPENIKVLQFDCPNSLPDEVWQYFFDKELLVCLWKKEDVDNKEIHDILEAFILNLKASQPLCEDYANFGTDVPLQPLIPSIEVTISSLLRENGSAINNSQRDQNKKKTSASNIMASNIQIDDNFNFLQELMEVQAQEQENDHVYALKSDNELDVLSPIKKYYITIASESEIKSDSEKINIPGVWAPNNNRGHAAGIYVFFRSHTMQFLPPDPEPDPPHVIVAFDAYKQKNIHEVCQRFEDAILSYGYFTSCDPETAKLIANSTKSYESKHSNVSDKLILKVSKITSHALLTLAVHGPTYVSPNTVVGEKECKIFFPGDYKTGEMEEEELNSPGFKNAEKTKKKNKRKTEAPSEEYVGAAVGQEAITEEQNAEEFVVDEGQGENDNYDGERENKAGEDDDETEQGKHT